MTEDVVVTNGKRSIIELQAEGERGEREKAAPLGVRGGWVQSEAEQVPAERRWGLPSVRMGGRIRVCLCSGNTLAAAASSNSFSCFTISAYGLVYT